MGQYPQDINTTMTCYDNEDNAKWFIKVIDSHRRGGPRRQPPSDRLRSGLMLMELDIVQYVPK